MCSRSELILELAEKAYKNTETDISYRSFEGKHIAESIVEESKYKKANEDPGDHETDINPECFTVSLEENEANRNENEIIENESDEEPFHADSDTDPDYIPTEDKNIPEVIIEPNKNITEATTNRKRRSRGNIERVSRKRIRDVSEWADEKSKTSLNLGLEHENRKGIQIKGRQMGAPCANTCRLKCATKIAKEDRDLCFNEFWKLKDHTRKWDFIARHVRQVAKKQVTITAEQRSRRNYSREYYFYIRNEKQRVCKTMFLETLNVSETWITTALRKLKDGGSLEEDKRGKHTNRPHKLSPKLIDNVKNHINQFPVVPSHYTRKNTMEMYLEEGLTIQKIYRLYNEHCKKNNITTAATSRQYRDIFNEQFNIGFFKPKKDQCTVCSVFNNMASDAEKAKLLEQYESHMKNKEVIRNLKDIDKQLALDDKSLCVACFDLQKVLATPLSNVSDFYYKSKYSTYNFTVYDVGNNQGYCYVWHEQVAKRGPNELLWLCNTGKIPTMYHGFYKNLNSKSYVPPKVELEVDSVESEEESDEEN
uniref:Uncharacterized protein LOC114326041 n=1 Tax=Diabrotica virgifera virgifera TaxID=50390 RepID=A0A6P7F318_DIAVI